MGRITNFKELPEKNMQIKTTDRRKLSAVIGFFYKYIYIFKTESVLWNVTEKVCLFLTRANGTKSDSGDEIYSSTELCLKGETVWAWIYHKIIDKDIL